jgi:hypothetical protein
MIVHVNVRNEIMRRPKKRRRIVPETNVTVRLNVQIDVVKANVRSIVKNKRHVHENVNVKGLVIEL